MAAAQYYYLDIFTVSSYHIKTILLESLMTNAVYRSVT